MVLEVETAVMPAKMFLHQEEKKDVKNLLLVQKNKELYIFLICLNML